LPCCIQGPPHILILPSCRHFTVINLFWSEDRSQPCQQSRRDKKELSRMSSWFRTATMTVLCHRWSWLNQSRVTQGWVNLR
jgi:hypothetical protein